MPELPDIAAYISALEPRIVGQPIEQVRLASPFLLRTVQPPVADVEGKMVRELRRIGKRIAIGSRRRSLAGAAPDDCRPPALEAPSGQAGRTQESGSLRFSHWLSRAYRSRHQAPRIVVGHRRRGGLASRGPGRNRCLHRRSQLISRCAHGGKSHSEESSYRSAHCQRHRQCVFG